MPLSLIVQISQNVATANTTSKTSSGMIVGSHTASKMAQPVYHHSPLAKSAHPKHEEISHDETKTNDSQWNF